MNIFSYTDKSTVVQWPSISVGSTFMDSTNLGTKIFPHTHTHTQKSRNFQKAKLEFAMLAAISKAFTLH